MNLRFLACFGAACALTGCAAGREEVWHGPQSPRTGRCDPPSTATLVLRGDAARFAPGDGTLTLAGHARGGLVTADLATTGTDHKPYPLTFSGSRQGGTISGTYATPRCRYDVHLTRVSG